jgi:hypothetical protein
MLNKTKIVNKRAAYVVNHKDKSQDFLKHNQLIKLNINK